jgi:hypothetical protein
VAYVRLRYSNRRFPLAGPIDVVAFVLICIDNGPMKSESAVSDLTQRGTFVAAGIGNAWLVIQFLDWTLGGPVFSRISIFLVVFAGSVFVAWLMLNRQGILERIPSLLVLLVLLVFPPVFAAIVSLGYYVYSYAAADVKYIAPGLRQWGRLLPSLGYYGTNAKILESGPHDRNEPTGPDRFWRMSAQMYCDANDTDCNAGWIVAIANGYDAGAAHELLFEIRGNVGGERVGVGIQDSARVEVKLPDVGLNLPMGHVTQHWETVAIPLSDFHKRQLDFTSVTILSFFVDARNTSARRIQIDIANVGFH